MVAGPPVEVQVRDLAASLYTSVVAVGVPKTKDPWNGFYSSGKQNRICVNALIQNGYCLMYPTSGLTPGVGNYLIIVIFKLVIIVIVPLGTRDNPAMSCQDIYNCNGDSFKPGEQ